MYLLKLYRYNKWLFAAILFFITMQLLVTYKRGMVVSPWYNYGMYSEKMYPEQQYEINNRLSQGAWLYLLSPQQDDKINVTTDNYRRLHLNDSLYKNEIVRLLPKVGLRAPEAAKYKSQMSKPDFVKWYTRKYASKQLPQSTVEIGLQPYIATWNGKMLQLQGAVSPH